MKFKTEIEIKNEHLKVLLDYYNGDEGYIDLSDRLVIAYEMVVDEHLLDGDNFNQLNPTPLGYFILNLYLKQRPKNPSTYEKIIEQKELNGECHIVDLSKYGSEPEPPSLNGIVTDESEPRWRGISGYDDDAT
jgi:hypothetical protein